VNTWYRKLNLQIASWRKYFSQERRVGRKGERATQRYLLSQGFTLEATNWRNKFGEMDIVARRGSTLHCIEVKTRRAHLNQDREPDPLVDEPRAKRIGELAEDYFHLNQRRLKRLGVTQLSLDLAIVAYLPDTNNRKTAFQVRIHFGELAE